MLRLQPHSLLAHQQGGCLTLFYYHSPETSFVPLCLNALRRTLMSFAMHIQLVAIKGYVDEPNSRFYPLSTCPGSRTSSLDLLYRLQRLLFRSRRRSSYYTVTFRGLGPIVIVAGHLVVPNPIELLTPNQYLTSLTKGSCLYLCFVLSSVAVDKACLEPVQINTFYRKIHIPFIGGRSFKMCFYSFRSGSLTTVCSQEISMVEFLGFTSHVSGYALLTSCMTLFYRLQALTDVVFKPTMSTHRIQ